MNIFRILMLLVLSLFAIPSAFGQGSYMTFDFPGAGFGAYQGTVVNGINSSGVITGAYWDSNNQPHGFIRDSSGNLSRIDDSAGTGTIPTTINSKGAIAGSYSHYSIDNISHDDAFLLPPGGIFQNIHAPDAQTVGGSQTWVSAINSSGTMAGYYFSYLNPPDFSGFHASGWVMPSGGRITEFSVLNAGTGPFQGTYPNSINTGGTIVGFFYDNQGLLHAFLRSPTGVIQTFDMPGAGTSKGEGTLGFGINQQGAVAGQYYDQAGTSHAFLRAQNGKTTEFDVPGASSGVGHGTYAGPINRRQTIVGDFTDADGVFHGYVRSSDGSIVTLTVPEAGTLSGQGTSASALNDNGTVAGYYLDLNNVYHGFVWTP